jgi:hypothetical protein
MLQRDRLNEERNPGTKERTCVQVGDTIVLNQKEQTLRILRTHNDGFENLLFERHEVSKHCYPVEENASEVTKGDASGYTVFDFFNFLLSVTDLVAEKIEFNEDEGEVATPDGDHWVLKEHPQDEFHG